MEEWWAGWGRLAYEIKSLRSVSLAKRFSILSREYSMCALRLAAKEGITNWSARKNMARMGKLATKRRTPRSLIDSKTFLPRVSGGDWYSGESESPNPLMILAAVECAEGFAKGEVPICDLRPGVI